MRRSMNVQRDWKDTLMRWRKSWGFHNNVFQIGESEDFSVIAWLEVCKLQPHSFVSLVGWCSRWCNVQTLCNLNRHCILCTILIHEGVRLRWPLNVAEQMLTIAHCRKLRRLVVFGLVFKLESFDMVSEFTWKANIAPKHELHIFRDCNIKISI